MIGPDGLTPRAALRDISVSGARLEGLRALRPGDRLHVVVIGRASAAEVRWAEGGMVGIRFEMPLGRRELTALAGDAAAALALPAPAWSPGQGRVPVPLARPAAQRSPPAIGAVDDRAILAAIARVMGSPSGLPGDRAA